MDIWHWLPILSGLLLGWTIVGRVLKKRQEYLEVTSQEPNSSIPYNCIEDVKTAEQLLSQIRRNPHAIAQFIQVQEHILTKAQAAEYPIFYATVQQNLGAAYIELLTGDGTTNLTKAIAYLQEALRFQTPENAPLEYAKIQQNLGVAYSKLSTGNHEANLAQARAHFQEALRFITPETAPLYSSIQSNLGLTYMRSHTGNRIENTTQAIDHLEEALRFRAPESSPLEYAMTQNNLGNAYINLPTNNRTESLTQAINHLQEALYIQTPENAPLEYAMTLTSLGVAYNELPTVSEANIAKAITCFEEALRFRTPETDPSGYAMVQNSLGRVYHNRLIGDRVANLARARVCFQEALRFLTPEVDSYSYAAVRDNLGVIYLDQRTGDREANIAEAITCFEEALRFRTAAADPFGYARTQMNLGAAYREKQEGDREANITVAIACFEEALRFLTPETAPFEYAMTQNKLGLAYRALSTGDLDVMTMRAIACFHEALRFLTAEMAPLDYAMVQNNLGLAYVVLSASNHPTKAENAITCFQEALRFRIADVAPTGCRTTCRHLGDLYFAQKNWSAALQSYTQAIEAGNLLYRSGLLTESKMAEVAENAELHHRAAYSAACIGEPWQALLILEQGKTRLLAEALRLRVSRPENIPDDVWTSFEKVRTNIRTIQSQSTWDEELHRDRGLTGDYTMLEQESRNASVALDAAIKQVRKYSPEFLREIDFSVIQGLISNEHAILITFCITEQGSKGFIVDAKSEQPFQVVELPNLTRTELCRLLLEIDADGRPAGGWLEGYIRYQSEPDAMALATWQMTITETLAELGKNLLAPLICALPAGITHIIFLPSAELYLLPLHAVPLSDNVSDRVCDRYQVSYTPSIEVLADTRIKAQQVPAPKLYAVINPQADPRLTFTSAEGASIAHIFTQGQIDEGRSGTKQRVITGISGKTYIHFTCHGSYDWNDPTQSGLDLADERLTLEELQKGIVDLSTVRLVTLSACETGVIDIVKGSAEEYVGIPAGFLLAGAPCVVSSLWSVPDLSTALLMEQLYSNHLSKGMNIAAAMRAAQLWVREVSVAEVVQYIEQRYQQAQWKEKMELFKLMRYYRTQAEQNPALRPFIHPYYWAAFTVNGM